MTRRLALDDIADLRAYERERDAFRHAVIALKKRRRIHVGPFVTFLFENRDTIRFQIQEMARAEKLMSDEQIQTELDMYNTLIPEPGGLAATMFIELTSDDELRTWLPQLVGIERSIELRIGDELVVPAIPEAAHQAQLTREEITAAVHYVEFDLDAAATEAVAAGPVRLALTHEAYTHEVQLTDENVAELLEDLRG